MSEWSSGSILRDIDWYTYTATFLGKPKMSFVDIRSKENMPSAIFPSNGMSFKEQEIYRQSPEWIDFSNWLKRERNYTCELSGLKTIDIEKLCKSAGVPHYGVKGKYSGIYKSSGITYYNACLNLHHKFTDTDYRDKNPDNYFVLARPIHIICIHRKPFCDAYGIPTSCDGLKDKNVLKLIMQLAAIIP